MSNVLICWNNRADAATLAGPTFNATWPLNNLKDGNIDKVARSSSAAAANTRFRFDLGAAYPLRTVTLANHNMSASGATWRVRLGTAPFDVDLNSPGIDERLSVSGSGYLVTGSNFTGQHSATAGTIYAEFDTPASGTRPIVSLDDNGANERIELYSSGTDLKFRVVDGGVTQCDITIGTISAGVTYKAAVAWAANDFAGCLSGGTVVTDASGTLPTVDRMRLKLNQAGDTQGGDLERVLRWTTRLPNATLQAISFYGPDHSTVQGLDTGWANPKQLSFYGDTPSDWGSQYNALAVFDETAARYGTVEVNDTSNAAGYVQIGRLFVGDGLQPSQMDAAQEGFQDSREELSTIAKTPTGKKYGLERRRRRRCSFSLPVLTQAEADELHEMQASVGLLDEVVLVLDPADIAYSQRYGGLGELAELSPFDYPIYNVRRTGFRWEEKL